MDLFPPDTPISDIRLLFIYTETTGIKKDQLWNIAWISYKGNEILDDLSRDFVFRPEFIDEILDDRIRESYELNSHKHETGASLDEALEFLSEDLPNSLPVVFNKAFDMRRLNRDFESRDMATIDKLSVFDPMQLARRLSGSKQGIDKLCEKYNIPIAPNDDAKGRHSAYYDNEVTIDIFNELLGDFKDLKLPMTFGSLIQFTYGK